ncbi:MAG TPA: hypothetical protein VJ771_06015 [Candidatus Nitrosotalea sp.]|nr:hypothetical protein [Candidatus Nitrosotalea sp.]
MKILHLAIITILLAIILHSNHAYAQNETTPTIWFDQASYATKEMSCYSYETGKTFGQEQKAATITITDQTANKYSTSIDRVTVYVWSDSDRKGIQITAYETEVNSGIFKGTVIITEGQSTQNLIHVSDGDTITAKYTGTTPWPAGTPNQGVTTTAFIGLTCPPLERVPVSGINITDNEGNQQKTILVNKQIQIGSKLVNVTIRNQTFAYIVQISDEHQNVASVTSVSGLLFPSQTFSPSVSWTPSKAGNYTLQIFVWQSIDNPNSLSPPLLTDITVWPNTSSYTSYTIGNDKISQCRPGYELVIRQSNNSTACVTLHTAQKLIERGWAKEIVSTTSGNTTLPASFMPCDTSYTQSTSFFPLLYIQKNSVGKICVNYYGYKYNLNVYEINDTGVYNAPQITVSESQKIPSQGGNFTIVYNITTGNYSGLYRLGGVYCEPLPLAVGYNNISKITRSDIDWMYGTYHCPAYPYDDNIIGLTNIGFRNFSWK